MSLTRSLISALQAFMASATCSTVINPPQGFIFAVAKITRIAVIDDSDQIVVDAIAFDHDERRASPLRGRARRRVARELRQLLEDGAC